MEQIEGEVNDAKAKAKADKAALALAKAEEKLHKEMVKKAIQRQKENEKFEIRQV